MYQRSDVEVLDIRRSIDGTKALLTKHPFSAVPLSRVIGPRKRPVLAAPPPPQVHGRRGLNRLAGRRGRLASTYLTADIARERRVTPFRRCRLSRQYVCAL